MVHMELFLVVDKMKLELIMGSLVVDF
jgi:hypothetical protein